MNRFAKAFLTAAILVASMLGTNAAQAAGGIPTVLRVTSSSANGTYTVGQVVIITVTFDEPVNLSGWPTLQLETGQTDRTVFYTGQSPITNQLTISFNYTVGVGDNSLDLNYHSTNPILLNGGSIVAYTGGASANLTFPALSSEYSLKGQQAIVVNGTGEAEQWTSPHSSVEGLHSFVVMDDWRENVSVAGATGFGFCSDVALSPCAGRRVDFKAVLPRCVNAESINCIESVVASVGAQNSIGTFSDTFPKTGFMDHDGSSAATLKGRMDFAGSTARNIPTGGPSSIYSLSGSSFRHAGASGDYLVTVSISGSNSADDASQTRSLFASVTPVSVKTTTCDEDNHGQCMDTYFGGVAVDQDNAYRCIAWDAVDGTGDRKIDYNANGDSSSCLLKRAFPAGIRFTVVTRLSTTPSGWLHGRMKDPSITFTPQSNFTSVSIAAEPVTVPVVAGSGAFNSLPTTIQSWFNSKCATSNNSFCGTRFRLQDWTAPNATSRNAVASPRPYSVTSFEQLELWKDYINDTSAAEVSHWSVRTLDASEMLSASTCISQGTGVMGIVSTNSTLYAQGPPNYDLTSGTLNYQVSSPHFKSDGTEFKGTYNLDIRKDIGDCLYNLSSSNFTSSVQVFSESGSAVSTAVTDFSETNGWYKFSASNFGFSAPTIKAKLQAVQSASAPSVDVPVVTVPAVTAPVVTLPAVTVPAVTIPAITPKIGTPVAIASPPAAKVAANLGVAVEGAVVRTAIKVPALAKGIGIKSYQVVLRSSSGKIVAMQTITGPVAGKVVPSKLTAPSSGNYKVEIVATTSKGVKLPKWTSPSIKLKK
jgi:hypothetical protein